MAEHNHSGETVLAFLLGGVVGAAVGVLLAPCSGEDTRRKLGDWFDESRSKTKEFIEKEREVLIAKKDQVSAAWEAGKKAYHDAGGQS
ncbi:MAG: YtxH domain-containing protein [Elusimicrobia bacterium]|nr:YtxH domain-containing protein [Elusimicrobiota bacterium]